MKGVNQTMNNELEQSFKRRQVLNRSAQFSSGAVLLRYQYKTTQKYLHLIPSDLVRVLLAVESNKSGDEGFISTHQYRLVRSVHISPTFTHTLTISPGSSCDSLLVWPPWPLFTDNLCKPWAWMCHSAFQNHPVSPHHLKRKESQASPCVLLLGSSSPTPSTTKWTICVSYCKFRAALNSPCCFTSLGFWHIPFAVHGLSLCPLSSYNPSSFSKLSSTVESLESAPFLRPVPLWLSLSASLVTSLSLLVLSCVCGDHLPCTSRTWVSLISVPRIHTVSDMFCFPDSYLWEWLSEGIFVDFVEEVELWEIFKWQGWKV